MKKLNKSLVLGIILSASLCTAAYANVSDTALPDFKSGTNVKLSSWADGASCAEASCHGASWLNVQIKGGANSVGTADWNSFNVGKYGNVNFEFTANNQTSLNRVVGTSMSEIYGSLTNSGVGASTGKVILINPNGVLFGAGANVNLNSFTASTLDGTYSNNKLTLKEGAKSNAAIKIKNGATITGDKSVALVSNNIYAQKGSLIKTGATGNVRLITSDGVNFTYDSNSKISKVSDIKTSTKAMNLKLNGTNIKAGGTLGVRNASTHKDSTLSADKAVLESDGNLYLKSNNNILAKSTEVTTGGKLTVKADKNITSTGSKFTANGGNANIKAESLGLLKNTITSKQAVNLTATESNLTSNKIKADYNVKVNSGDYLLANGNNIKSGYGTTVTAKESNLYNNTINAEYGINLKSDKSLYADGNKITAKYGAKVTANDAVLKNNTIKADYGVKIKANNKLTANSNNITAGYGVNIYAERQLKADANTIKANDNVNVTSYLDEMSVTNNKITSGANVKITSDTNTLNAKNNTIKADGSVTLTADKDAWGKDFGIYFKLNANNNNITAGNNANFVSKGSIVAQSNTVKAVNNVNVKAVNNINLSKNELTSPRGYVDINTQKGRIVSSNNTYSANKAVYLSTENEGISYFMNLKDTQKFGKIKVTNDQIYGIE